MSATDRRTLMVIRPNLAQGGADRVTILLLRHLDRARFAPSLVLMRATGEYVNDVPKDVPVTALNARNVGTATLPLMRYLREQQPQIVFSTSSGTNIPLALAHGLTGSKARLVLSERNILHHGGKSFKRRSVVGLKRQLYRRADCIIALSQGVKDDLVAELGLPPELVMIAYSPVDVAGIRAQMQEPIDHPWLREDVPLIVAAGRFVKEKDFATLLNAFARVRANRAVRLILLGEGPLRAALVAQAEELGVTQDVWFPGFDKNPFKYMARASIVVVSSQHEGLCTVLIQAMACGAPVITTDYEVGAREIVTDRQDGLIVRVADPAALAEKMGFLLDHPEKRRELGQAASESARRFDIEPQLRLHEKALLGGNRTP